MDQQTDFSSVSFAYPAYGSPQTELIMQAQVLGDLDTPTQNIKILYTSDGASLARRTHRFSHHKSSWVFRSTCHIETIRQFFKAGEGEYFLYTHYDGTQWVFHLLGANYRIDTENLRGFYDNVDINTHTFQLQVERWPYA